MRVTISGKSWLLKFVPKSKARGWIGLCSPPDTPRVIQIEEGHSQLATLDALIHESLHASAFPVSEDYVDEAASDIAKILWRLGWRKTET